MMKTNRRVLSIACACVFALSTASLAVSQTQTEYGNPDNYTCKAYLSLVTSGGMTATSGHYADNYYDVLYSYVTGKLSGNGTTTQKTDSGFHKASISDWLSTSTAAWADYYVLQYNAAHTVKVGSWGSVRPSGTPKQSSGDKLSLS